MADTKAIVIHSGGMDSSICLKLAIEEFGPEQVMSLSFAYGQRNVRELDSAKKISADWNVRHELIEIPYLAKLTHNALTEHSMAIEHLEGQSPNTLVVGRNGLMVHVAGIYAGQLNCARLSIGVEEHNSGYRDCSRHYFDLQQEILRMDLDQPEFEIRTPLINMYKWETLELAKQLGVLDYLLTQTITCYEGIPKRGCQKCPSCELRNNGIQEYQMRHPSWSAPY